jgi:hypothetical protein
MGIVFPASVSHAGSWVVDPCLQPIAVRYERGARGRLVGIMNSILLSVQDRIRDFGTLRAIAFTGHGASAIIAVEALLLGACASFLAVMAAWGVSAYFERHGIPLGNALEGVWSSYPSELNTRTDFRQLIMSFAAGTIIPVLAGRRVRRLLKPRRGQRCSPSLPAGAGTGRAACGGWTGARWS